MKPYLHFVVSELSWLNNDPVFCPPVVLGQPTVQRTMRFDGKFRPKRIQAAFCLMFQLSLRLDVRQSNPL